MNRRERRVNTARNRRLVRCTKELSGIFIASTDDGVAIEFDGTRLDMTVDKAIEVASSLMVGILPAAMQGGDTLEGVSNRFYQRLVEKCDEAQRQTETMPS